MNIKKEKLKQIGQETLAIIQKGFYLNSKGEKINIEDKVKTMIQNTILVKPKDGDILINKIKTENRYETVFEVKNKTTLEAAKDLLNEGFKKVIALNFASAKNPGGGFLNGSNAQEESLVRSSALYASISQQSEMYEANRKTKTCLYTDYMIYSPDVPVFRNDQGELLDEPFLVSFITAPAVNTGVVKSREPYITQSRIDSVMKKRIEKILAVALHQEYDNIVLGAFGCGVFRNSPKTVAAYFKEVLTQNPRFENKFKKVVFAVLDHSEQKQTYQAFADAFQTK